MHAYNLFRRKGEKGVYCAVPEDRVVPTFLRGDVWEFTGKVEQHMSVPVGFDRAAAPTGVRFNGFYLFQAFSS